MEDQREPADAVIASVSVWVPFGANATRLRHFRVREAIGGTVHSVIKKSSRSVSSDERSDVVLAVVWEAVELLDEGIPGSFLEWAKTCGAKANLYVTVTPGPQGGAFDMSAPEIDALSRLGASVSVDAF